MSSVSTPPPAPAPSSAAPLAVDRYVLCDPIAVGGMATVYFARQRGAAGFSKAVAIKRMRPDLVHEREFADLFVDEARLASRVRHANVVGVIDVVASGEELLLVMEYLHGESLARLLATASRAKTPVPPPIAIAIVCNVLLGLHAAHEAKGETGEPLGIVHRDVSPQNVIVGVDGVARVADFGIARAVGQIHATDEGKTRGKAGYSAPEQLRGGPVTRKIDLFAACALLWEILVGRRLFDGETQAAVITAVLTEPIEPAGLFVKKLPEELDDVIMRGLDRDPKKRPETALELASLLEKAVPPAGPAAVAEWVLDLARADLERREEIVRKIEAGLIDDRATAPLFNVVDGATAGSMATSRSPSLAPPSTQPQRSRVVLLAAIGLLIVATFLLAASIVRSPSSSTTPAPPPVAASSPPPPAAVTSTIASNEPPAASSSSSSSSPSSASAAKKPLIQSPPPAVPKRKNCDPPYDIDPAGRKIFRVECL